MKKEKGKRLLNATIAFLLISGIVVVLDVPGLNSARASGPLTISFLTLGTMFTPAHGGDVIEVSIQGIMCIGNGNPGACTSAGTGVTSITDTQGTVYSKQVQDQLNGQTCFGSVSNWNCDDEIWTGTIAAGSATTITITFAGGGGSSGQVHEILDVANAASPTASCTAKGNATTGTAMSTSSNCSTFSGAGTIASYQIGSLAATPTVSWASNVVPPATGDGVTAYSSTFTASTNFPATQFASNPWQDVAIILQPIPTATVTQLSTKVVACNFFQFECWMYPLVFLSMFAGFFIGVGMAFKVSEKAFMYLLISGMTLGSLIEIQLGIMTPMLPILLIVGNIAYSLRIDRLILGGSQRQQ